MGYLPLSHNKTTAEQQPDSDTGIEPSIDGSRTNEAAEFLAKMPQLQLISEFLKILRGDSDPSYKDAVATARKSGSPTPIYLSWWSLHDRYDSYSVLDWFVQRPDIRQGILGSICNFPSKAARLMEPAAQANLIEMVIESNDRSSADFDAAIRPEDVVVYGPADDIFRQFSQSLPKEKVEDAEQQSRVVNVLAESLMLFVDGIRTGSERILTPLMTPIDLRMILGFEEWHRFLPPEVLADIDKRRVMQERKRPDASFTTRMEFQVVGMQNVVKHFPYPLIRKIFDVAAARRIRLDKQPVITQVDATPAVVQQQRSLQPVRPRIPQPEATRTAIEIRSKEPSQPKILMPLPLPVQPEAPAPTVQEQPEPPHPVEAVSMETAPDQPETPPEAPPTEQEPQEATPQPVEAVPMETAPDQPETQPEASQEAIPESTAENGINFTPDEIDEGWGAVIGSKNSQTTHLEREIGTAPGFLSEPPPSIEPTKGSDRPITVDPEPPSKPPPPPRSVSDQTPSIIPIGELPRETNYISNAAFDAVRDGPADESLPPPPRRSGSTSDLQIMRFLIEIRERFGLRLPDDGQYLPVTLTKDIYNIVNDMRWIADESRMREAMIYILHGLDPEDYNLQGDWTFVSFNPLCTMFLSALKDVTHPLIKEAGRALERSRNAPSTH